MVGEEDDVAARQVLQHLVAFDVDVVQDGEVGDVKPTPKPARSPRRSQRLRNVRACFSGRSQPRSLTPALEAHPAFDSRNPNRARALYGAFCSQNLINFHRADGSGYTFLAERVVAIDASNPQLAARLLSPMTRFRRYDHARQRLMVAALERIRDSGDRSTDVREQVVKSLAK